MVELHGGRIEVASEVGRGTTFSVYLPANPPALTSTDGLTAAPDNPCGTGGA